MTVRRHRWLFGVLLAACGTPLWGCGLHLYNGSNDAQAQAARKSYEDARLLDVVVAERANLDKLLALELGVAGRHLDTVLRAEWFRLADSRAPLATSLMERGIGKRLTQLGLLPAPTAPPDDAVIIDVATMKFIDGASAGDKAADAFDLIRRRFRVEPPACGDPAIASAAPPARLAAAAGNRLETLTVLWEEYRAGCAARAQSQLRGVGAGPLKTAFDDWQKGRARLQALELAHQQARARYEQALQAYESASTAVPTEPGDFEQRVGALRALLEGAETSAEALGVESVAAARIKSLDVLLQAAAGDTVADRALADGEVRKAVMVVATSRALTDEARAFAAERRAPRVAALLIEKQRQEALRGAAARRVERAKRRVELQRERLEALALEVYLLQRARVAAAAARGLAPADDPLGKPLGTALSSGEGTVRRLMYQTLFHYVDSIVTARRRQEEADYRLIALDHEEAVDASETAIALWNGLITTPVNQLAAYHGSGVKAEQLAALIVQLVTLGSIGVGVNR
jgi:hypothetical protein